MVKPLTTRHIGQAVGLGGICGADFLGQQTEEDGCHFCAGDVAIRLDVAVRVADNVRKVVVTVQTGRYIIRNVNVGLLLPPPPPDDLRVHTPISLTSC